MLFRRYVQNVPRKKNDSNLTATPINFRVLPSDLERLDDYAKRLAMQRGSTVTRSSAAREILHRGLNAESAENGRERS